MKKKTYQNKMHIITITPEDIILYWTGTGKDGNPMFSDCFMDSLIIKNFEDAEDIAGMFFIFNVEIL